MIFSDYDRIVFAGDSVTDMGSDQPVGEGPFDGLGIGYVREVESLLTACYPELRIRVTNSGVSGNTSRELLGRFERDVTALAPEWIAICIGINDVWRQFDCAAMPERQVLPEEYRENLRRMLAMARACGSVKGIFLLTPFFMEPERREPMRARMDTYVEICKELAAEQPAEPPVMLVDFQDMYDRFFRFRHSSCIAWDRVHPNRIGALLMAREFLRHCGFDYDRTGAGSGEDAPRETPALRGERNYRQ